LAETKGLGKCCICFKQINEGQPIGSPPLPRMGVAHKMCADREQYVPAAEAGPVTADPIAQFQRPKPHLLVGQEEGHFKEQVAKQNARLDPPELPPMEETSLVAHQSNPLTEGMEGCGHPPKEFGHAFEEREGVVYDNGRPAEIASGPTVLHQHKHYEAITIETISLIKTLFDAGLTADKVLQVVNSL
jgi:hypothetical protein